MLGFTGLEMLGAGTEAASMLANVASVTDAERARVAEARRASRQEQEQLRQRGLGSGRLASVEATHWDVEGWGPNAPIAFELVVTRGVGAPVVVYRRWSEIEGLRARLRRECKGQASVAGLHGALLTLKVKYKSVTLADTTRLQKRARQVSEFFAAILRTELGQLDWASPRAVDQAKLRPLTDFLQPRPSDIEAAVRAAREAAAREAAARATAQTSAASLFGGGGLNGSGSTALGRTASGAVGAEAGTGVGGWARGVTGAGAGAQLARQMSANERARRQAAEATAAAAASETKSIAQELERVEMELGTLEGTAAGLIDRRSEEEERLRAVHGNIEHIDRELDRRVDSVAARLQVLGRAGMSATHLSKEERAARRAHLIEQRKAQVLAGNTTTQGMR
jgi:hypothetical protein